MEEKKYCYKLFNGNEIVYIGITNNLDKRLSSHRSDKKFSKHKSFGKKIESKARIWEIEELKKYRNNKGQYPKYNKSSVGSIEDNFDL
jgi:predicted GIY-YIG superfamily endonuclease